MSNLDIPETRKRIPMIIRAHKIPKMIQMYFYWSEILKRVYLARVNSVIHFLPEHFSQRNVNYKIDIINVLYSAFFHIPASTTTAILRAVWINPKTLLSSLDRLAQWFLKIFKRYHNKYIRSVFKGQLLYLLCCYLYTSFNEFGNQVESLPAGHW